MGKNPQVNTETEQPNKQRTKAPRQTDPALRLANKMDALMEQMPPWAQDWALNFLWAKHQERKRTAVIIPERTSMADTIESMLKERVTCASETKSS